MLKVGQKVRAVDRKPAAVGIIIEVSTWEKVIGKGGSKPCYLIHCQKWVYAMWLNSNDLELIEEK